MNESARKAAFNACPILESYIAAALEDLQFSESDESYMDGRKERDTGTIYDCAPETFQRAQADCVAFMESMRRWIVRAIDLEPGEDGLRYSRHGRGFDHARIGYYLYMQRVGHGVGFTDDGDDESLQIMADYCRSHRLEGLYFGDDNNVYWI